MKLIFTLRAPCIMNWEITKIEADKKEYFNKQKGRITMKPLKARQLESIERA